MATINFNNRQFKVAVKIQYPGVRQSLSSDVASLRTLLLFGNFLPKGLFLERTLDVLEKELIWETDYLREAAWMNWFRIAIPQLKDALFGISEIFPLMVPYTFSTHSGPSVLTTEWINGISLDKLADPIIYSQEIRDKVKTKNIFFRLGLQSLPYVSGRYLAFGLCKQIQIGRTSFSMGQI